jgi:two-component system response regulator YesN
MWDLDDLAVNEILSKISDLELDEQEILTSLKMLSITTGSKVQAAADLLFVLSNQLAQSGMMTLMQRRELNAQQARLAEEIYARKRAEEVLKDIEARADRPIYPFEKEQELLGRVRIGDRTGAKEILNELLGSIFFRSGGNDELIKARLLELMVVLSRAAVEAGASMEKLLGLNYSYVQQLSGISRFDDLCVWIVKVLDTFLDVAAENRNMKNAKVIHDAVEYITANYNKNLVLEEVAQVVYLSPYYLSHLFRSELGCTFVEYVTKIRIETAKKLMRGSNNSLSEISEEIGYKDSGYFSKVFRKSEGMTPSQYRQHMCNR